jgi:hypothetical protein
MDPKNSQYIQCPRDFAENKQRIIVDGHHHLALNVFNAARKLSGGQK